MGAATIQECHLCIGASTVYETIQAISGTVLELFVVKNIACNIKEVRVYSTMILGYIKDLRREKL